MTLVAFAANSILCRMALKTAAVGEGIDPASFTTLRLLSGALVLLPLARLLEPPAAGDARQVCWKGAAALFGYALAFSWAYVSLDAGVGALILFGAVQITMIGAGVARGERPGLGEWAGVAVALGGLGYLVLPGASAPDPLGALLMCGAGLSWGIYSLLGKGVQRPVAATARNFTLAVALAVISSAATVALRGADGIALAPRGVSLACLSGAVTSGLGYVLWYKALRGLSATRAAIVQLSVPVIAACGGVLLLGEEATARLAVAALMILGGVAAAVLTRRSPPPAGAE